MAYSKAKPKKKAGKKPAMPMKMTPAEMKAMAKKKKGK